MILAATELDSSQLSQLFSLAKRANEDCAEHKAGWQAGSLAGPYAVAIIIARCCSESAGIVPLLRFSFPAFT